MIFKTPNVGDDVIYHPAKSDGLPEGTVYDARVASVRDDGKLNLILDGSENKDGVSFMQDDRGSVPDFAYAVWPMPAYSEREMTAREAVDKFGKTKTSKKK